MGKCDKELAAKLLAELLASLFVQYLGCCVTDSRLAAAYSFPGFQRELPISGDNDAMTDVRAEALWGSFFGMRSGAAGVFVAADAGVYNAIVYAACWAGGVMAMTQAFRIVSGAHINPCVSIASMILKNVKVLDGCLYILMQLIGSCVGFILAFLIYNNSYSGAFCVTSVLMKPWWVSILLEFFLTGVWVFALCASWHKSNEEMQESIAARIGLIVFGITLIGAPHTQTCMNPFRSLWPAIIAGNYDFIYVYIAIPIVTAILLAFLWRYLVLLGDDETVTADGDGKNE